MAYNRIQSMNQSKRLWAKRYAKWTRRPGPLWFGRKVRKMGKVHARIVDEHTRGRILYNRIETRFADRYWVLGM
jgi:hypothetical protein